MPITEGHYNVVLKGKWYGSQDIVNSFYFEMHMDGGTLVGDDDELANIGERFWDAVSPELLAVTGDSVTYNTIDVFKADGADVGASGFYTIPSGEGTGLIAGESLPPFVTWTFQYTRPDANFRHGYKRFAGVPETWQNGGNILSDKLDEMAALAAALNSDIKLNDALINAPYIEAALVQRQKNGQPVDPDVWYKPSTVVYKKIGSQNTRKYNIGS